MAISGMCVCNGNVGAARGLGKFWRFWKKVSGEGDLIDGFREV